MASGALTAPSAAQAAPPCKVVYVVMDSWSENGTSMFRANVFITNTGSTVNGWTLRWEYTAGQFVTRVVNARLVSQTGGETNEVTTADVGWNAELKSGETLRDPVELFATYTTTNPVPQAFYVNDYLCENGV